jgi:hypothetical protein
MVNALLQCGLAYAQDKIVQSQAVSFDIHFQFASAFQSRKKWVIFSHCAAYVGYQTVSDLSAQCFKVCKQSSL